MADMFGIQFYPTPEWLVDKMLDKVNFSDVTSILEPSAGKGDIILRNEAWLKIENLVPMCEYREMSYLQIARQVLKEQQFVIKGMSSGVEAEWERFWEKVVKLVREYIGIKGY